MLQHKPVTQSMVIANKKVTANKGANGEEDFKKGLININEDVNMYNQAPENIISLHEFYKLALDRL